jgi:hypothetical protein
MRKRLICIDYVGVMSAVRGWKPLVEKHRARGDEVCTLTSASADELDYHDWHHLAEQGMGSGDVIFSANKADPKLFRKLAKERDMEFCDVILIDDGQTFPAPTCEEDNLHVRAARRAGASAIHFTRDMTVEDVEKQLEPLLLIEPAPKTAIKPKTVVFGYGALTKVLGALQGTIKEIKENGHGICLVTNVPREKMESNHRYTDYIADHGFDLEKEVRCDVEQDDPEFYEALPAKLHVNKEDIVVFDIEELNIEAATKAGLRTMLFEPKKGLEPLESGLKNIGILPR